MADTVETVTTLAAKVAVLSDSLDTYKSEVDAFYLMWAGARVARALKHQRSC